MLKSYLKFAVITLALLLSACGSMNMEKPDETKGWSASKLYAEAMDELNTGNFDKALKFFEKLESSYPFGNFAQQAQMETAYVYYRQNDQAQCLAAVERFIRLHPNHQSVDYMYYLRGLANFNDKKGMFDFISNQDPTERDPKAARDAFDAFKLLTERFPNSKYAPDSRDRMKYLVNALAQHEIHVAKYYARRGSYLAAANRAQSVIREFPDSPSAQEAMRIQIKAYDALGLKDLRDDAERVYLLNFQNQSSTPGAKVEKKPWWQAW